MVACVLVATQMLFSIGKEERLKVMTFNVRCVVEADGLNQWKNRKDFAANLVKFYAPDIWGSQEDTYQQMLDLQERLPEYAYIGVGRTDGKTEGEYAPIFYKKDRFALLDQGHFWLAAEEKMYTPGVLGWDADYPRVATWGIFEDKQTGKRFFYLNTHLDHMGKVARHEGAKLVLKQVEQLSLGLPVIVSGDFNAVPTDDPIKVLTNSADVRALTHTRSVADFVYGPEWTFHDFGRIPYAERQWIDYIFVKGPWKVYSNAVLTDFMGDLFPSDHCPVLVEMEIR